MYFLGSCEGLWGRLLDEPNQQAVLKHGAAGKAEHVIAFLTVLYEMTLLKCTGCLFSAHDDGGFLSVQSDDPVGPNIDLEKKMDVEKRCMGLNDYNGDMRKGGRGGGGNPYRPPVSKEAAPVDAGSYYDKVTPRCHLKVLCLMCLSHVLITFCLFLLFFISSCGSSCLLRLPHFSSPPTTQIGLPLAVAVTDLAFDQSGLVPWGGGSLLSVLTTHCLQAPFPLQPHYPL